MESGDSRPMTAGRPFPKPAEAVGRAPIAEALPIGEILGAELISTLRNGHPALVRLYHWMQANDPLRLTMREASAIACLEQHYFSSLFHRQTGLSFTDWRMRLRVFRAAELIAAGEVSIDQAVERVGYNDRRSLERATQRLLGITPKALRASRSRRVPEP